MAAIDILKTRRQSCKEDIIRRARSLAKQLNQVADGLAKLDHRPSNLGEVQTQGTILDVKCGAYWELCEAIELLEQEEK